MGLPFSVLAPQVEEVFDKSADPLAVAEDLALRKVRKALEILKNSPPLWVCGADTLIVLDGKILGKPLDRGEAEVMLRSFRGRSHQVITAVVLYNGRAGTFDCRSVRSNITFAPLSDEEIRWYLDSGEWRDAAGSYKIQGLASCFITSIEGSHSAIAGLPLREFYAMLRDNGYQYGAN